jgi:hypothetical protein
MAANRTDVCSAGRLRATKHCFLSLGLAPMGDEDESHLHVTYASHLDMDDAFCDRMRAAIAAGLESAPTSVVTAPGTRNPKYVPTKQVVRFSQGHDF